MRYTYQTLTESGSFSAPWGDDVGHASSTAELRSALECWTGEVSAVADEPAWLRVWIGHEDDVTDLYPDFELFQGPRGGAVKVPC